LILCAENLIFHRIYQKAKKKKKKNQTKIILPTLSKMCSSFGVLDYTKDDLTIDVRFGMIIKKNEQSDYQYTLTCRWHAFNVSINVSSTNDKHMKKNKVL